MRVVAGKYKGLHIPQPKSGEIRPTTDRAKEGLFNILTHKLDFTEASALDLFAGSGSISIELASRGCPKVLAVEQNFKVVKSVNVFLDSKSIEEVNVVQNDVFRFIKQTNERYNIIFADPPYHHPKLRSLPDLVFSNKLLTDGGLFILEHPSSISWDHEFWIESRPYGQSIFSFFSN